MNSKQENFFSEKPDVEKKQDQKTIVDIDMYLKYGAHIGTKYKNGHMKRFIFKARPDKLNVMDVQLVDSRIKIAIDFIFKYKPEDVVFISRKRYALPGMKFLEKNFNYKILVDRFIPGTFTNPNSEHFIEPKLVFIADPNVDRQAVEEATKARIPIVALATTSSNTRNIDLIIPFNNKGKKSVALFFWILNRELLLKNGFLKSPDDYKHKLDDFVYETASDERTDMYEKDQKRRKFIKSQKDDQRKTKRHSRQSTQQPRVFHNTTTYR